MPDKVCFIWDQALCQCPRARCLHKCIDGRSTLCDCVEGKCEAPDE